MLFPRDVPVLVDGTGSDAVTLRAHREDDVQGSFEQCQDPVSQAWTTVPVPYTRDDARRFVREAMPAGWQTDQEWAFAVEHRGQYGGTISLRNEGEGRAEIAYGSHPRVRGAGVMERALRLLLEWGFSDEPDGRGLQTVVWRANRGNWASRKLAWRLGFDITPGVVRQWLPQRGVLLDAWVGTLLSGDERKPRHRWIEVPTIESPRLPVRLRAGRESDADRLTEGVSDPDTVAWLGGLPQPFTVARALEQLRTAGEGMASGTALHLVLADTADDRLLGALSIMDVSALHQSAEIGYWTHPAERGRGVATEGVRLAARHAVLPEDDGGLGLARVFAYVALENTASRAVLARAGMPEVSVDRLATRTRNGLRDAARHELLAAELPS